MRLNFIKRDSKVAKQEWDSNTLFNATDFDGKNYNLVNCYFKDKPKYIVLKYKREKNS